MARGIEFDLDKLQHLHEEIVRRIDELLGEAVSAVENGAAKANVSISFEVSVDEEGLNGTFTLKSNETRKGSWCPAQMGQARLIE